MIMQVYPDQDLWAPGKLKCLLMYLVYRYSYVPGVQGSYVAGVKGSYVPGVQGNYVAGVQGSYVPGVQGSYVPGGCTG